MHKVTRTQQAILRNLLYPEPYNRLLDETSVDAGTLRDELISLINHGFVEVYDEEKGTGTRFYDSDQLHLFQFRATSKGLKSI